MKHISKFDGLEYLITRSYEVDNNNKIHDNHDVTLIWREGALYGDAEPRTFIGWYCGDYSYEETEDYIREHYLDKLMDIIKVKSKKPKTIDLPICYVNLITDCLEVIKEHNLFSLLSYDENCIDAAKSHLEEVLERFCEPLEELCVDTKIIIEEDE